MSGMSEDSDYTSDINYPLSHQHNSSAHQFRGEPNYPLNRDNSREYNTDYVPYDDDFDGDEYDHRRSFEHMDSYDRAGSYEREIGYEERGSFERRNSYDRDYDDREYGDYINSDEDYDQRMNEYDDDERGYDSQERGYVDQTRSYDRRIPSYDQDDQMVHDYEGEEIGSQSSIRDYDSERDYEQSDRDYERTITNQDSLKHDMVYDIFDSPDYPQESRKYSGESSRKYSGESSRKYSGESSRKYSAESSRKYSTDSRKISQSSRGSRTEINEYSRESDYLPNGSPYHIGRSDTDSEPLSYNSRPIARPSHSNIVNPYGRGG